MHSFVHCPMNGRSGHFGVAVPRNICNGTRASLPDSKEGWLRAICTQTTTTRLRGDFSDWSLGAAEHGLTDLKGHRKIYRRTQMAFVPPHPPLWGHHRPLGHCPIALWGFFCKRTEGLFIRGLGFLLCSLRHGKEPLVT